MATTQFLLVTYDAPGGTGSLFAMWLPVSVLGLSGYRIFLQPPQGDVQTFDAAAATNQLTIPITIVAGFTVGIAVLVDGEAGPASAPLGLISAAPYMLAMIYDVAPAATLSLLWQAVNQSPVTGYVAVLEEVGTSNQWTRTPAAPPTSFDQTLDPARQYQATVRATGSNGVVQGPATAPLTAITASTQMLLMVYDLVPSAKLSLMWHAVGGVSGYVVVLDEVGTANQWNKTPSTAQTEFDQTLDPAREYRVTVRATNGDGVVQGPATVPLAAITASTRMESLIYDLTPSAKLSASWQPVNSGQVGGYVAVLSESGTANQWTATPADAEAEFDQTLDAGKDYQLAVRATGAGGIVQGPATAPLAAITTLPQILAMVYDTASDPMLTLAWTAVSQGGADDYIAVLAESGTTNQWITTPSVAHAQFEQFLGGINGYQATVRATASGGIVQGPATAPLAAITASTQMLSMTYDVSPSAALALTWQAVDQATVTGYLAVLSEIGTANQWNKTPTDAATEFDQALDTDKDYQVTVRAIGDGGVVQGPATAPLAAIATAPILTELDYNPGDFIVSWTQAGGDAIDGYAVIVANPTLSTAYPAGDTDQATLPITLDPAQTYSVVARATGAGGVVEGPPSAALAPLLTAPANPTLVYTGTGFSTSWTADANPAVGGYVAQLLRDGAVADEKAPAASPTGFDDTFDSGTVYASWVRSAGASVKGPWTSQAPGPYRSIATLSYDGLGRISTIARANAATTVFTFDPFGNLLNVSTTAGAGEGA